MIDGGVIFDFVFVMALVIATIYSSPPFSLKKRGIWGFIADSLIEKPLPILVVFVFFRYYGIETILFPLCGELFDSVFKHQVEDFDLDSKFGVKSFAISVGKDRSIKAVKVLAHPLNCIAVISLIAISLLEIPKANTTILVSMIFFLLGLGAILYLDRAGRVRDGFPFPDPPLVGYLNFGFRAFVISSVAFFALVQAPQYFPVALLSLFSIALYLKGFYRLVPDLATYMISGRKIAGASVVQTLDQSQKIFLNP